MICPHTKAECPKVCEAIGCVVEHLNRPTEKSGMALSMEHLSGTRKDARMAELARRIDAFECKARTTHLPPQPQPPGEPEHSAPSDEKAP